MVFKSSRHRVKGSQKEKVNLFFTRQIQCMVYACPKKLNPNLVELSVSSLLERIMQWLLSNLKQQKIGRLLTDDAKCGRQLFIVDANFAVCHQSCRWEVVKNCCWQQKVVDSFSLFKRENALTKFNDRQHKIRQFACSVSKQSSVTKSRRWEKVISEKKLSTASCGFVKLQPKRPNLLSVS